MQIKRLTLCVIAIVFIVGLSLGAVYAQDTEDKVACDADLILNLYIAEKFFDFNSFVQGDMGFNLDAIDKGQFEPLFNDISSRSDFQPLQMSAELRNHLLETVAMTDAEFDTYVRDDLMPEIGEMLGTDTSTLTMLQAQAAVPDEAPECAALRGALRRFFVGLVFGEVEFGDVSTGNQGQQGTTGTQQDTTGGQQGSTGASGASAGAITVNLLPSEEVPGPGEQGASGMAVVYLRPNTNEVCVDISIDHMTLPATAAHIHQAADGQAGPPVVTLNPPGENGLSSTCTTVDAALMQELVNNPQNFYVNVHNADFPDGAARGQMSQQGTTGTQQGTTGGQQGSTDNAGASAGAITVNLVGAEEIPGPGDEDASGTAVVYLRADANEVCVDITVQHITLPATAAHIHQAVDGQAGPPVVTLTAPGENGLSSTCTTVDAALMQEMVNNPQNFYVNVHNVDFPDGAVRGQMGQ